LHPQVSALQASTALGTHTAEEEEEEEEEEESA